ncbi:class I SAM-dependent methyltransferase [Paractinoplanes globisporus]|uniref:Class I SAM-dependent methyltransferase n=1 Tax=Paractinoplanes globisporus TaxID=113565 RepID=A0ABW6WTK7_9ACTN|nr:class I SAM-dependent methyltransferase [Actinoplanes globisporus]
MSDEQAWDARYSESHRIWSGNPNVELVTEIEGVTPGRALDLGCGEGADAVWLARQGWRVTAVDISGVALERAAEHAKDAGVEIDFQRHDLEETFPAGEFDLISAQFLHFWEEFDREKILRRAADTVAPGGILLIEGHMDHGPFRHEGHDGRAVHFPTPDEVVAALALGDGWEVLKAEVHPRQQKGPDGDDHTRTDSTVKLRRKA